METDVPAASLDGVKARLSELKALKGRLGRQIDEARQQDTRPDDLISEMQRVAKEIKRIQKRIKSQQNNEMPRPGWTPQPPAMPGIIAERPLSEPFTVSECGPDRLHLADRYIADHPAGSIWHRPGVTTCIQETFGHKTSYLCASDAAGRIVGVLPLVQLRSRLFGNFLVSLPYFNYGGVLADHAEVADRLIEIAATRRKELGAGHVELRFSQDTGSGRPQRTDKVTFWLPLPNDPNDLWHSFPPKLRAQIRRGERGLTELVVGGEELLDEFYRVFSINMRDLGTPVYGRVFFRNLLRALGGQAWLVIARVNGQAVGCAFLTGYRNRMEIPWASTLRSHSHTAVNMILYWRILQFAMDKGYEIFDFGRCSEDAGTYRFKQQWGAQPLRLYWEYILPTEVRLPALNPGNPKFRLLIAAWKRLPVWLANRIGPRIVRVLP